MLNFGLCVIILGFVSHSLAGKLNEYTYTYKEKMFYETIFTASTFLSANNREITKLATTGSISFNRIHSAIITKSDQDRLQTNIFALGKNH